jgi:hypothetical protein
MKFIYSLLFLALLAFVAWPYYHVYRIDDALGKDDLEALAELVDLQAIQQEMTQRLDAGLEATTGQPPSGSVMGWLQQNLRQAGEEAVEETITIEWVRDRLRAAVVRASDKPKPYFIRATTFAFFESYDSFIIRLGELGKNASHIRMKLEDDRFWRITGIYD